MHEGHFLIGEEPIDLKTIKHLIQIGTPLGLSGQSRQKIEDSRAFVEDRLKSGDDVYYGINTGFGSLYNVRISNQEVAHLQENLIRSHACGAGPEVEVGIARLTLLLKILSLSKGYSGVRAELVDTLITMYNAGILPVLYRFGSLGASGDLAPLAHLGLTLIGEGMVSYQNETMPSSEALQKAGIEPLVLQAKEGLALINGTQFSNAFAVWGILESEALLEAANHCAAASIDAFNCNMSPFHPAIQQVRGHEGQIWAAEQIRRILKGSPIAEKNTKELQDPYAFRCIPQVHGASYAAFHHAASIVENETNAVTDNPIILEDIGAIISGGNFHAQPVGLVMDYLAIALSELGNISERRTYQMLSGDRNLPDYLVATPGLQSGMMITQYTAASLVNRNKLLANPSSTDSIISSKGQEDHVSMSANAGIKLYELIENAWSILGIEWLVAMQALEFRKPLSSSGRIEQLRSQFRQQVEPLDDDRSLAADMLTARRFLQEKTRG